jgi:hypothetical protein
MNFYIHFAKRFKDVSGFEKKVVVIYRLFCSATFGEIRQMVYLERQAGMEFPATMR